MKIKKNLHLSVPLMSYKKKWKFIVIILYVTHRLDDLSLSLSRQIIGRSEGSKATMA